MDIAMNDKPTWDDFLKAALFDSILHAYATHVEMGHLSREEAAIGAAVALAKLVEQQHAAMVDVLSGRTTTRLGL